MVGHVCLSFRLDGLHCFYQAAAGKHHIAGCHVFGLQLPQALLAVPDPIAKIHTETWGKKHNTVNGSNGKSNHDVTGGFVCVCMCLPDESQAFIRLV